MGDVGLLGDTLVFWEDVRERREVVRFWVLDSVGPEDVDPRRVDVYPLVPAGSPSVVMHVNGIFSDLRDLSLQPLIDGVFNIEPHSDLKLSLAKVELGYVRKLTVVLILSSSSNCISEPTVLRLE